MLGRARIGTGELEQAYENFKRSYELSGDGRSAACIAYVTSLMTSNPPGAIDWHQRARAAGFDSPEMQNNDAYCHRRITELPAARRLVEQALAAKPELETAILNLALIEMQEALSANQAVPVGVFDRALEKCPESYGLYMGAAAAVWKSDMKEPERSQRTIDYLRRALELGAKVDIVRPSFTSSTEGVPSLNGNPAFDALVTRTWNVTPVRPIYVSDPLGEFPSTRAGKYD